MQTEARAVLLALSAFSAVLPSTMDVWVDNTSLQGAANKGSSKSHALTWELQRIYGFFDSRGTQATFAYVRSAENPADGISRGRVFLHFRTWRRGAAVPFGWRTPKSPNSKRKGFKRMEAPMVVLPFVVCAQWANKERKFGYYGRVLIEVLFLAVVMGEVIGEILGKKCDLKS